MVLQKVHVNVHFYTFFTISFLDKKNPKTIQSFRVGGSCLCAAISTTLLTYLPCFIRCHLSNCTDPPHIPYIQNRKPCVVFKVSRNCPHLIDALQSAIYDPDKFEDERLDDGTSDIDSLDAMEYSLEPYYKALEQAGHRTGAYA